MAVAGAPLEEPGNASDCRVGSDILEGNRKKRRPRNRGHTHRWVPKQQPQPLLGLGDGEESRSSQMEQIKPRAPWRTQRVGRTSASPDGRNPELGLFIQAMHLGAPLEILRKSRKC